VNAFILSLTLAAASNAPVRPLTPHAGQRVYPDEIVTDSFEVTDVNIAKGLIAFKHVYQLVEFPPPTIEVDDEDAQMQQGISAPRLKPCAYPGLTDKPKAGLTYGIWDLNADKLKQAFTVYESTFTQCTPARAANTVFAHYQETMKTLGLDWKKRSPVQTVPSPKNGEQAFTLTSKTKTIHYRAQNIRVREDGPDKECGDGTMLTMGKVWREDKPVWVRCQQDSIRATTGGSFIYPQALVIGKKVIFVEAFKWAAHESGARDKELWSFTKPLPVE
jgi:hypothetical protein